MKTAYIETYGCQMNQAESNALALVLAERNWKLLPHTGDSPSNGEKADLIIINTCSVRETAETRALGRIDHYVAQKKHRLLTIIVCGCMAERIGEELLERGVDYAIGTMARSVFPEILQALEEGKSWLASDEPLQYTFSPSHHHEKIASAFVPVMHGCNNFCSYCIVPYVRGREVSRDPKSILVEIHQLLDSGVKEITLLGQNVNSYTYKSNSTNFDFPQLLDLVAGEMPQDSWLRFLSSHPKDYDSRLTEVIARHQNIPRYLHLCVQHGSNTMLKAMNRKYTREEYVGKIRNILSILPEMHFSTDILIGFPGETEKDLQETLELMEEVMFSNAFMYHYNPRQGPAAFDLPGRIPYEVKTERLQRVIDLQLRHSKERMAESLGKNLRVLVEGPSKKNKNDLLARTARDEMLVYPGSVQDIGSFIDLHIEKLRGKTFIAKEID